MGKILTLKQKEDVDAMSSGGGVQVRVVDGDYSLLLFFEAGGTDPVAAVKLSSDQAHTLAVLLVQAAERTVLLK